ncbi:hypothetical protein E2C01_033822 [Portunus trituberculatus]|uniref:Uncharacterized protein n=1 Tax=Portunus trituberculatus TaxID=210409 RepID=A0A5B7F3Q8_PORTR|nr:hypothetical protein [Portunus trituberculatus]
MRTISAAHAHDFTPIQHEERITARLHSSPPDLKLPRILPLRCGAAHHRSGNTLDHSTALLVYKQREHHTPLPLLHITHHWNK